MQVVAAGPGAVIASFFARDGCNPCIARPDRIGQAGLVNLVLRYSQQRGTVWGSRLDVQKTD